MIETDLLIAAYVLQCTVDEIRAIERDGEGALHVYYRGISTRITPERADRAARDLTILAANLPRDVLIARSKLQPGHLSVPDGPLPTAWKDTLPPAKPPSGIAKSDEPAEQPRPHRRARSDE